MTSNINSSFFVIEFNEGHEKAFVKVRSTAMRDSALIDKIKTVFTQNYENGRLLQDIDLSKDEVQVLKFKPKRGDSPALPGDLHIKVMRAATDKALPMRARTIQETYDHLYARGPKDIPVVQFIWKFAVYPLALFYRAIYPTIRDLSELRNQSLPSHEESLLTTLKWSEDLFENIDDPLEKLGKEFSLRNQFKEAVDYGESWKLIPKRKELVQKATGDILKRLKSVSDLDRPVNLMLLPAGYWKDANSFQPLQWAFYCKGGKLCLSQTSYGKQEGNDYTFNDISEKDLMSLINTLMLLSTKPSNIRSKDMMHDARTNEYIKNRLTGEIKTEGLSIAEKFMNAAQVFTAELSFGSTKPPSMEETSLEMPIEESKMPDYISQLVLSFGAEKILPQQSQNKTKIDEDSWQILHKIINSQFPETPIADKTLFTFSVLSDRLTKLLSGISEMTQEEREQWTYKLKADWDDLQISLQQEFDDPEIMPALLSGQGNPFAVIGERLRELNITVEKLRNDAVTRHPLYVDQILKAPPGGKFAVSRPTETSAHKAIEMAHGLRPSKIGLADIQNIEKLKVSWKNENASLDATISSFDQMAHRLNQLVENGDTADALRLYHLVMEDLPPPEVNHPFWSRLSKAPNSESFNQFNRILEKMTHYFWEAKVKKWETELSSVEYVDMMATEAAMLQTLTLRAQWVEDKLKSIDSGLVDIDFLSPNIDWGMIKSHLSFEDIAVLATVRNQKTIEDLVLAFNSRLNLYEADPYFRPGLSSALQDRIMKIENMRSNIKTQDFEKGNAQKINTDSLIFDLWNSYENGKTIRKPLFDIDSNKLKKSSLSFESQAGPRYPHQLVSLFRQNCFFQFFPLNLTLAADDRQIQQNDVLSEQHKHRLMTFKRLDIEFSYKGGSHYAAGPGIVCESVYCEVISPGSSESPEMHLQKIIAKGSLYQESMGIQRNKRSSDTIFAPKNKTLISSIDSGDSKNEYTTFFLSEQQQKNPFGGTEAEFLNADLKDSTHPLETWELNKLEFQNSTNQFAPQNVEAVFNYIIQHPDKLDETDVRRRLLLVCTRPGLIKRLMDENPDYFTTHAPLIKEITDRSIKEGNFNRAAFAAWLFSLVEKKDLSETLVKWIHDQSLPLDQRLDMAVYLLHNASELPFANNPELIAQLLFAANQLQIAGASSTMPIIAQEGVRWAEEDLSLWLRKQPQEFRDQTFNRWSELRGASSIGTRWSYNEKNNLWHSADGDRALNLDHLTLDIPFEGIETRLPIEVTQNATYQQLFGKETQFTATVKSGDKAGTVVYSFKDRHQHLYRLNFDGMTNKLVVERNFEAKLTGEKSDAWYELMLPLVKTPHSFDKLLVKRGLWVDLHDSSKGITFLCADAAEAEPKDVVKLSFDSQGQLRQAQTCDHYQITPDTQGTFANLLNPVGEENLLCLSKKGEHKVSQIRLLDQGITLQKTGLDWIVTEGPYKGCKWVIGAQGIPLASYGVNVEQFGMALQDSQNGRTHMLLWPQRVLSKDLHKKTGSERISFEKNSVALKPTTITFYENGSSSGNSEGFIYLAYLFAAKHDHHKALVYLQKATEASRLKQPENVQLLETLDHMIRKLPADSFDAQVFKLKTVLSLNKIKRQQTGTPLYIDQKEQREKFIKQAQYIGKLLDRKKMERTTTDSLFGARDLRLTGEEIEELENLQKDILQKMKSAPQPDEFKIHRPDEMAIQSLFPLLLHKMKPVSKNNPLQHLTPLNENFLVSHFFHIWNQICQQKLEPKDIPILFAPIPGGGSQAETARAALLFLAASDEKIPFDINELSKIQDQIPKSTLSLIVDPFRSKPGFKAQLNIQMAKIIAVCKEEREIKLNPKAKAAPIATTSVVSTQTANLNAILDKNISELEAKLKEKNLKPSAAAAWLPADEKLNPNHLSKIKSIRTVFNTIQSSLCTDNKISPDQLIQAGEFIKKEKSGFIYSAANCMENIFIKLRSNSDLLPEKLRTAAANEKTIGKQAVMDEVLEAYQTNALQGSIVNDITAYLLYQTAAQQLDIAEKDYLNELITLHSNKPSDPKELEFWKREWNSTSTTLLNTMQAGLKLDRYLEGEALVNPRFSRKFLVTELRTRMILRPEQLKLINEIMVNPNDWYELRMGLGKTSLIMPTIMLLFAEDGKLPVALVKEELLRKNVDDMDTSTRLMRQKAGIDFEFSIASSVDTLVLKTNYYRLLKVKDENGYVITSVSTLAALNHRLALLTMFLSDPEKANKHEEMRSQINILTKIRSLLTGKNNPLGFPTQLFGDEVDALFSVLLENNLAVPGDPIGLDPTVRAVMKEILEKVYMAKEGPLHVLKSSLENSEQAALSVDKKKEAYETLAKAFFPEFQTTLNCSEKLFVEYICAPVTEKEYQTKFADLSFQIQKAPVEVQQRLGALKRFNQTTLGNALSLEAHIDAGYKESKDPFMVGPQISGQESEGMLFSDLFDIIANHMIFYSLHLPDGEFVNQALKKLREQNPSLYNNWKEAADQKGVSLPAYLNIQENWSDRITFFNTVLIEGLLIKRFGEQFIMNVQETVHGLNIGGATGTRNRFQLPVTASSQEDQKMAYFPDLDPKESEVEKDTLERIKRTNPTVAYAEEHEMISKMESCLQDFTCKAVINEGCPLGGKNSYDVVKGLRQSQHGLNRYFIFTDPNSRKTMFWEPGIPEPKIVSTTELNDLLRNPKIKHGCLFYFGPPDTRGTDYKIPAGHALMFSGVKTTKNSFQQAVWRLRGLGERHTINFVAPKAIKDRIKPSIDQLTDFDLLYSDIANSTKEIEMGLRLKAVFVKVSSIINSEIKDMLFDPAFWEGRESHVDTYQNVFASIRHILISSRNIDLAAESAITTMRSLNQALNLFFQKQQSQIELAKQKLHEKGLLTERDKKSLDKISASLDIAQKELVQFIKNHPMYLKDEVPSLGDGIPSSQEKVQEQAIEKGLEQNLEQAQQKDLEAALAVPAERKVYKYDKEWDPLQELSLDVNSNQFKTLHWLDAELGSMLEGLQMSRQMHDCYDQLSVVSGAPLGHFMIYGDRLILISQTDYILKMAPMLKEKRNEIKQPIAVYSILNGARCSKGIEVKMSGIQIPNHIHDSSLREKMIRMKFLLGFSEFSEQEENDFKSVLKKLSTSELEALKRFVKNKGSQGQAELLKKLNDLVA